MLNQEIIETTLKLAALVAEAATFKKTIPNYPNVPKMSPADFEKTEEFDGEVRELCSKVLEAADVQDHGGCSLCQG